MSNTIINLAKEISQIISSNESNPIVFPLHDRENHFLIAANSFKKGLIERKKAIEKLEALFAKLSWYTLKDDMEEEMMDTLISDSLSFHLNELQSIFDLRGVIWEAGIFKNEIVSYEDALNTLEETIYEVKEVFFNINREDGFNELLDSI